MVFNPIFCYVSPKIVMFREPVIIENCNKCHWIWHSLNPKYVPLKPFWCIFPSQNQQNVNFWLFPDSSPWQKTEKNINLHMGKSVCKGLQISTYRFLNMPIAMHYIRTLCDEYFLSYYGFSSFFTGRSRYRVLIHGVEVQWDPRRTAEYIPSHFNGFNPIFCSVSPKIVMFQEPFIVETRNKCHWIWHTSNPIWVIQAILMHFSQSKSTKCESFAWNCDFSGTAYHRDLKPTALDLAFLKPYICTTQAILMHFSQSKSTKCEISAWNCDFSRIIYCKRLETCGIRYDMPQTLYMHHSSHFDAFFPVKINKMWNFGCFLNSPWQITEKKPINLHREKVFKKDCKSAYICFWVCHLQCTMLELCGTSTWGIMVFLHFLLEGLDIGFWNML